MKVDAELRFQAKASRSLAFRAQEVYGSRCPCCDKVMERPRGRGGKQPWTTRTCGHDVPVSRGGDPGVWVWICRRCNEDQADLTFDAWAWKLRRADDYRAARVRVLAEMIAIWRQER